MSSSIITDRVLIQQIRARDEHAWRQLIARYEGRLIAFASQRLNNRTEAEDVVQDTFIGFFNGLANFDDNREVQTFLFSIASHKVIDRLRSRSRRPQPMMGHNANEMMENQSDERQRAASSHARDRERIAIERGAIARAIQRIVREWQEKEEYQRIQILELIFVKGYTNQQTARHFDVNDQHIANVRFAAMRKLKENIADSGLSLDIFPQLSE